MSYKESRVYKEKYELLFIESQNALIDNGFTIKAVDFHGGQIMASASMSWKSWGEILVVTLDSTLHGTNITMVSKPYISDWGKSKKNVENFFNAFEKRLAYQAQYRQASPDFISSQHITSPLPYSTEPSPTLPAILALVNGIISLLYVPYFLGLDPEIGGYFAMFMFLIAMILFTGSALVFAKKYKAGAIFCIIGGAITIPIGMLGIFAGIKARVNAKWLSSTRISEKGQLHPVSPAYAPMQATSYHVPPSQPEKVKPLLVKCYSCGEVMEVVPTIKPFVVSCNRCGKKGVLK